MQGKWPLSVISDNWIEYLGNVIWGHYSLYFFLKEAPLKIRKCEKCITHDIPRL